MWAFLARLATGGLRDILAEVRQLQRDRLDAANDADRIRTDERIAVLRAHADEIRAARQHLLVRLVQALFAGPFVVFLWKVIVYDKVLGMGATDGLSPQLWQVFMVILGGFFVLEWRRR